MIVECVLKNKITLNFQFADSVEFSILFRFKCENMRHFPMFEIHKFHTYNNRIGGKATEITQKLSITM